LASLLSRRAASAIGTAQTAGDRARTGQQQGEPNMHLLLPLPGHDALAQAMAASAGFNTAELELRRFPDGESYVRIASDVAARDVALICTLADPDPVFLQLIFAADAARDLGARSVTLVAPYLAYMRQDKRFKPGEAISSRSFARLISSTFDRLVTVDPHLHRYPSLDRLYTIPASTLQAAPVLADWIGREVDEPLLIGPDSESEQWVSAIAQAIGAPHAVLSKVRHGDRDVEIALPDLSGWRGRQPVLVDDIASSGQTLIKAAGKLGEAGLKPPVVAVIHPIFAGDAYPRLKNVTQRIVSTNSIAHESNAIDLAPLLAGALNGEPS
jgi:ribose-phosphate pyrophosphokinase